MIPALIVIGGSVLLAWMRWRPANHPRSIHQHHKETEWRE